jgi:hypothetical protein
MPPIDPHSRRHVMSTFDLEEREALAAAARSWWLFR